MLLLFCKILKWKMEAKESPRSFVIEGSEWTSTANIAHQMFFPTKSLINQVSVLIVLGSNKISINVYNRTFPIISNTSIIRCISMIPPE